MKKTTQLILYILVSFLTANANNFRFHHLTSENGLPHQQAETLLQDEKGYIWIGTRNGLSRYDGYSFENYFHDSNNPHSLCNNFIKKLFIDHKNRVWVCTVDGVCRYRPATNDFKRYDNLKGEFQAAVVANNGKIYLGNTQLSVYDEKADSFTTFPPQEHGYIISLAVDKDDNLYAATNSSIYYYNADMTQMTVMSDCNFNDFLTHADDIVPLYVDNENNLWIGRNGKGVMRKNLKNNNIDIYDPQKLSNGIVRTIIEDNKKRIWLGTEKGITIINPDNSIEIVRHNFIDKDLLSDNAIYSIICDKGNNIWIGSYFGGVDVLLDNSEQFTWLKPGANPQNISGMVAREMIEADPGIFWIATEDGGLNCYNLKTNTFHVPYNLPDIGTNIHSVYFDKETSNLWIGTFRRGLFVYNTKSGTSRNFLSANGIDIYSVFDIMEYDENRILIASIQGLFCYDKSLNTFTRFNDDRLGKSFVYCLCSDNDGNLWAGTVYQGLFKIDMKTKKVTNWSKNNGKINDNYITSIFNDSNNKLWIGTNNNGLKYIDNPKKSDKIESVNSEMLLAKSTICGITEDSFGHIWISTSQGLFQYKRENNNFNYFSTENGLPTNHFNFNSIINTSDNRLMFGTVNGIVIIDPSKIKQKDGPFNVHLKNLFINNVTITAASEHSPLKNEIDSTDVIRLSHVQARSFSIEYGVIQPGNISNIDDQVKLDGFDKNWRDVGNERKFTSYNLPSGTYTLYIRANNTNKGWEECPTKKIKIIISPTFYASPLAYIIYFLLACTLTYLAYKFFNTRMKERNEIRVTKMEKEKIEEIDKEKFDFFTSISHELKTPLSLIVAPLKSIKLSGLNKDEQKNLEMAISNTKKMENLINELITFNKIETNQFPFYIQKGNPLSFIEIIVNVFSNTTAEKNISLSVKSEDNGEEVWFSPSYVEKILNNLLSNAIKFTPEGGKIEVRGKIISSETEKRDFLSIEVEDNGIGIAKEEIEKIFNRYYQTKRGYNVDNRGWGIGLPLVKRLAEIHKGEVAVKSVEGKGSTFSVRLCVSPKAFDQNSLLTEEKTIRPIEQYQFSAVNVDLLKSKESLENKTNDNEKVKILIVEDNPDLLTFLTDYFIKKYNIAVATNGEDAIEIAHNSDIQLIISDVMMPKMDGYEMTNLLKSDMETSHIPIILLTAKSEQGDIVTGFKSGAEAYVTKPFDPQILELQINNILALQKKRQQEIVDTNGLDLSDAQINDIDLRFIKDINRQVEMNLNNSDFSVTDITKALGISRSMLHKKMTNLFGISISDYIRKRRFELAIKLLKEGYRVSEVAYMTGFTDPGYFSRTFKRYFGKTPSEYIEINN